MSIKRWALLLVILILVVFISLFFAMGRQVNRRRAGFQPGGCGRLPDGIYQGSVSTLLVTACVRFLFGGRIRTSVTGASTWADHGAGRGQHRTSK